MNESAYLEIRNRDENWSEAKALLAARIEGGEKELLLSSTLNSNMEPLGGYACFRTWEFEWEERKNYHHVCVLVTSTFSHCRPEQRPQGC